MSEIETIVTITEVATNDFLPETQPLGFIPEAVIEAIWCSQGNITRASKLLECSHSSLWNYIKNNEKMLTYLNKVREYKNDIRADVLEDLAFNKALYGDSNLIWKLLCTYGSNRGYGDKQQLDIKYDVPPHIKNMLESLTSFRSSEKNLSPIPERNLELGTKSETNISTSESSKENKPF